MIYFRRFSLCLFTFFFGMLLLCGNLAPLLAEEIFCDKKLESVPDDPLGYQMRDDRCEGKHFGEPPTSPITLVSLTESFENYTFDGAQDLIVEWSLPKAQRVALRANRLRSTDPFYRMDTIRSHEANSYRWPVQILQSLQTPQHELGVVGWAQYSMKEEIREIYLPLRIGQQAKPAKSPAYHMILWAESELSEVYLSLATVTADGSPDRFLWDGNPLKRGYYPAKRGIVIEIPKADLEGKAIYYLEIGAILKKGGVLTEEFRFYHAGSQPTTP